VKGQGGDPRELLGVADGLLLRGEPATAGFWPRAAALLALQALQSCLVQLWERNAIELHDCSMRTQLICLPSYLEDARLAARAGHAWSALSRACHHHTYELAPTSGELRSWLAVVGELVSRVESP